jgi:general secretion pathway protein I
LSRAVRFSGNRPEAGFTMIEVLVSLALVASSLAAIGALVATTMRGVDAIERHVALVETARNVAATIGLHAQVPMSATSGAISGHRWRIDVSPWTGGSVAANADSPWIPEYIRVRVQSPSGAVFNIETVRLLQRKRPNGS